ncbi:sigma-54-dependent Fis family transcriptional regulator [bacterium]|nr:sigma-54-dependent Fis family transcriptional regulator [candidate division CSSED10-310 bacterium]
MKSILVVDDEQSMCDFLSILLEKEGYNVISATSGMEALKTLRQGTSVDLVISDIMMPEMNGMELLKHLKAFNPNILVIMITAYATTENAIQAMKQGAYDYVTKPFKVDEIKIIVQKAFESLKLKEENIFLKQEIRSKRQFENIIGISSKMIRVFETIRKIADLTSTVLIAGESGTGKELVASAIHYNSVRKDKPFVTVNCGALPENLLESELFGHVKGSFTGAIHNKEGLFEIADGGTFFLDEVAEMSPPIQVKLLRVLNDRKFKRVGGVEDISVDVRIISATNKDLTHLTETNQFREDLFYRLNVIPIHVPPLRERREDIPILVDHFIRKYCKNLNKNKMRITAEALNYLQSYSWPGNVRELENVIERCVALESDELITPSSLPSNLYSLTEQFVVPSTVIPEGGLDLESVVGEYEKSILINALRRAKWIKKDAAKLLNVSFRSLRYRVEKYGLEHPDFKDES